MAGELRLPEDLIKQAALQQLKAMREDITRKDEEIATLRQQLAARDPLGAAEMLSTIWLKRAEIQNTEDPIQIDDPVYDKFSLPSKIGPVYSSPLVRRLHHIKQLAFANFAFPSALHSRFSHSLGVCRNAVLAIRTMLEKRWAYSKEGKKQLPLSEEEKQRLILKAALAALLHDIGHGPFGHALDRFVGYSWPDIVPTESPDKILSARYMKEYLRDAIADCGLQADEVVPLIGQNKTKLQGFDLLVAGIVDSPMDVDRMDYLMRDAYMTGLPSGIIDISALIDSMVPFEDTTAKGTRYMLAFHPSAVTYMEHFFYARDAMYIRCYEDEEKLAGEGMLVKAVAAFNPPLAFNHLVLLTDDQLLNLIIRDAAPNSVSRSLVEQLLHGKTFELLLSVPVFMPAIESGQEPRAERGSIVKAEMGNLEIQTWWYDAVHVDPVRKKAAYLDKPRYWEQQIAGLAGLPGTEAWKVLVTVPPAHIYLQKDVAADILVREETGYTTRELGAASPVVSELLATLRKVRLQVRVFVSPDVSQPMKDRLRKAAQDFLGHPSGKP